MIASTLDLRDRFNELADLTETIAALEPAIPEPSSGHAAPGSRLPPGMTDFLDDDERDRALAAVHEWAEFCTHDLLDAELVDSVPDATPARLRLAAQHAAHYADHDDEMFAISVQDDVDDHLRTLRRLSRRGSRVVQTGVRCQNITCRGHLVSPLGRPDTDRHNEDLECDTCHARIPHVVWSSWPRARVTYITIEHAAKIAGTTTAGIKMRASRGKWRKVGTGRDVRYHVDDVRDAPVMTA